MYASISPPFPSCYLYPKLFWGLIDNKGWEGKEGIQKKKKIHVLTQLKFDFWSLLLPPSFGVLGKQSIYQGAQEGGGVGFRPLKRATRTPPSVFTSILAVYVLTSCVCALFWGLVSIPGLSLAGVSELTWRKSVWEKIFKYVSEKLLKKGIFFVVWCFGHWWRMQRTWSEFTWGADIWSGH